jgi:hypothetical protein
MKIAKSVMEVTEEKVNNTICLDWKYVTTKPIAIRLGEKQQNHSITKKQDDAPLERRNCLFIEAVIFMGKRDLKFGSKEHNGNDDKVLKKYYTRRNNINLPALNMKQLESTKKDLGVSLKTFSKMLGVKGKVSDSDLIYIATVLPGVIRLPEHHLTDFEIEIIHFPKYKLGATFCRKKLKNGGSCIYIHEDIKFTAINVQKYGKEQDFEIAALQIRLHGVNVIIIITENFDYFLKTLDHILQFHHKNNIEFVICGDINVDYLENNRKKAQLNNMLKTYNLTSTVYFPTTTNITATLIDNILINYTRNYNVNLCVNGLSDHYAQLITINGITITKGT